MFKQLLANVWIKCFQKDVNNVNHIFSFLENKSGYGFTNTATVVKVSSADQMI